MPSACESITIARAELSDEVSRALIDSLNAELSDLYCEPGANHFRLDPEEVAVGRGVFLVVYHEGTPVGCGALRLLNAPVDPRLDVPVNAPTDVQVDVQVDVPTAELKRMYVSPPLRGKGLGRRLLAALEAEARALPGVGVRRLVLETGTRQAAALALYRAAGFRPIPLYGEYRLSPQTSICLGKDLLHHDP